MRTAVATTDYSRRFGADCEAHSAAIDSALEDIKTHDGTFDTVLSEATESEAFCRAMHKLYAYMANRSRQGFERPADQRTGPSRVRRGAGAGERGAEVRRTRRPLIKGAAMHTIRKPVAILDKGIRSEAARNAQILRLAANKQFLRDVMQPPQQVVPSGIRIA